MRLTVEIMLRGNNHVFTETIVHPATDGGLVIALEIHSASAVAGPIPMAAATLEGLIGRAVAADTRPGLVH